MHKALRQRSLTSEERLKVASYIWKREGRAKEVALTKWACEEICSTYSKKARSAMRLDVCTMLWEFLSRILGQKGSCYVTSHLIQACITAVSSGAKELHSAGVAALRWSKLALELSPLPPALYKYDLFVSLVEAGLKMGVVVIMGTHPSSCGDIVPTLTSLLIHYVYLQSTQANPKKVFTSTCSQLLESMLLLRRSLTRDGKAEEDICNQLSGAIDEAILQLFSRDHLPDFPSALEGGDYEATGEVSSDKKRSATSYVKVLLHTLRSMVEAGGEKQEAVHEASSIFFKYFLDQNRKENTLPRSVEFQFLFKLLSFLLGHCKDTNDSKGGGDGTGDEKMTNEATKQLIRVMMTSEEGGACRGRGLHAVLQCLQVAQEYEVYQAVDDGGGGHLAQLEALTRELLCSYSNNQGAVVDCVRVLMKLNHKGVEPILPAVWGVLFCQGSFNVKEGDICGLIEDCIHTYARLKQLRVLVETQLEALRVLMELGVSPTASPAMPRRAEDLLRRHVEGLPQGQCVEMMEVMVSSLQGYLAKLPLTARSKRRKKGLSSSKPGEENGTLEEGSLVTACVLKLVDLFGAVVCSVPLDVWGADGLQKEKAKGIFDLLVGTLAPQLMEATSQLPSLVTPALYLSYLVCQVTACLRVVHPSVVKDVWPLPLVRSVECHDIIPQVWASSHLIRVSSDPSATFLMKHIAILCLKFGEEHALQKELAEYVLADVAVPMVTDMNWSGQLLEDNKGRLLQLVLTQFPVLYHHCDHTHMCDMARAILHCLLSCGSGSGKNFCYWPHPLVAFLQSPAYQDMHRLHEALIASVLFHSASKAPESLHEDLKFALRWSSEGGSSTCQEVLSRALTHALDVYGSGDEDGRGSVPKAGKRSAMYVKSFEAYVQVLSSIPMETLSIPTRLQLLVSSTCWHIAAVRHLLTTPSLAEDTPPLHALHSLVASIVASLVAGQKEGGRRRRKGACPPQYLVPADMVAKWSYVATRGLVEKGKASDRIVASSLVALETCVQWCLANSSSCEGILKEVATDLDIVASDQNFLSERSSFAERCTRVIVSTVCKVYKELSSSPQPYLISSLELAVSTVTTGVAQLIHWSPDFRLRHFALLAAFAELVASCAFMLPPLSKMHACVLYKDILHTDIHFDPSEENSVSLPDQCDLTLAALDILMFPVNSSNLATQESPSLPEDAVLLSWGSLHSHLFHLVLCHGCRETLDVYRELKSSKYRWEGFDEPCTARDLMESKCLCAVSGRVLKGLMQLLGVATREQTKAMFDHIVEYGIGCPVSLGTFCLSWNIILDSKLTEDSQRELRIWLCKVLLHCMSAMTVYSTEPGIIVMVTELIGKLVSIPSQVGLDSRSVVISLHVCSALNGLSTKPSNDSVLLLNSVCHLLSAVVRNHASVAGACPGAIVASVNKLLEAVLDQAQRIVRQSSEGTNEGAYQCLMTITHTAAMISRLLEVMAKHAVLAKFACYSVVAITVSLRTHSLHERIKQALLPGLCCMIRACSDRDSAFIRTMLGQSDRDGYEELLEEYKSYHRFTGRV